jgi:transcriptional regulator GlxA family with amidase domain
MAAPARQTHAFVLLPQSSLLALAATGEALAAANDVLDDDHHSARLLSLDGQPVRSAQGARISVDGALDGVLDGAAGCDAIYLLAEPPAAARAACHALLRAHAAAGAWLVGIGGGALALAEAGVLDGHRATLDAAHASDVAARHPGIVVSSNLYEIDRRRLTCHGGSAVLEMMIAWLGQRHGDKLAQALVAHFGLERLRAPEERPRAPEAARLGSSKLADAVTLMEANLAEPLPTEDIARLVGVSRRQLERLFKQHLDELPSRYYAELRLARARRLLQQGNQSILQVGLACGFASGSHFSNAYRARFGHTPREARSLRARAWRDRSTEDTPS